jgi:hypothetical protein
VTTSPQTPTDRGFFALLRWLRSGEGLGLVGVLFVSGCLLLALVLDSNGDHLYEANEYVIWLLMLVMLGAATEAGYWLGRRAKLQKRARKPVLSSGGCMTPPRAGFVADQAE